MVDGDQAAGFGIVGGLWGRWCMGLKDMRYLYSYKGGLVSDQICLS